jgi:predicted transcriptional regulator YdeE
VRKTNVSLKNYPAIKFVLSIKGVNEMKFKIVEKPAFSVVGIKLPYKASNSGDQGLYGYDHWYEYADIRKLWEVVPKETYDKLLSLADDKSAGFMGIFSRQYLKESEYLITVASSKEIPEGSGFVKYDVPASRYAVLENDGNTPNLHERFWVEWLPSSGYERASNRLYPTIELYTSKHTNSELWFPIEGPADVERKRKEAEAELQKIENSVPRNTPVDIDLKTMTPYPGTNDDLKLSYTDNGLMIMHPMTASGRMGTAQEFTLPIKIELRAKIGTGADADEQLRLYYGGNEDNPSGGWLIFFYYGEGRGSSSMLKINDVVYANAREHYFDGFNFIPYDTFVGVEWILGDKVMGVKIDGKVYYASCEQEYIEALKNGAVISSPVYPGAGEGSTVTVDKLRVTEI